jgi:hypothetical protein
MESLGKAAVYFINGGHAEYDAVELLDSGVLKALDKVKPGRASVLIDQPTGTEYKVVYYSQALWTSVQPVSTIKIDETP